VRTHRTWPFSRSSGPSLWISVPSSYYGMSPATGPTRSPGCSGFVAERSAPVCVEGSIDFEVNWRIMMDDKLVRELAALGPPGINRARARAVASVAERVQTARLGQPQRTRRMRMVFGGLALALSVVFAASALWTAPGQAVATWIGERFGAGEPGGPPALEELRTSWNRGTVADGQPAYVLVAGPAPHGGQYEFIAYRPKDHAEAKALAVDTPCFELILRQERSSSAQGCGVLPDGGVLFTSGFGGGFGRSGQETFYTTGRTTMDVESVDVRFNGSPVEAELAPVPVEPLRRIGIEKSFKFFIAFLPNAAHGGNLIVTAFDEGGGELARKAERVPDLIAAGAGAPPEAGR
jgi:hypothetical protein